MEGDEFYDYYSLLKVSPTASPEEIERAYRFEIRYWHPDNYASHAKEYQTQATQIAARLNQAKEILTEPTKRSIYDQIYVEWQASRLASDEIKPASKNGEVGSSPTAQEPLDLSEALRASVEAIRRKKEEEASKRRADNLHRRASARSSQPYWSEAIGRVRKILELELRRGADNGAVIGGIDPLLAGARHDSSVEALLNASPPLPHGYSSLSVQKRQEWIRALLNITFRVR